MIVSSVIVTSAFALTCWAVGSYPSFFQDINADVGLKFYAERLHLLALKIINHAMPFNTLITYVYSLVGFYWVVHCVFGLKKCKPTYPVSPVGLTYISAFSLMSLLYGPIHLMRIVKQKHTWAVLDQWFTLPFFGLVIHFLLSRTNPKLQLGKKSLFASVSLSHASYGLALLHPLGFDLALAIHILISAILGYSFYNAKKEPEIRLLVVKTVLSCAGFVVLKLADFYLAELHLIFEIFSGHFLSKVCDVMQIYYSLLIMEADLYDSSPQITEMGQKKK
ncbi:transmembrane protein 187-like [Symsagittifera roscoffensis]|uniref:transmembrane protein 187-like n=1 Tax=Symsagittifera roscoffensis TaxID=84072 RepID=UPI00307B6DA0